TAYSSTAACKSHRALAGVLNQCTHAAQKIDPFTSVRQEITPCLVRRFQLNPGLLPTARRSGLPRSTRSRGPALRRAARQISARRRCQERSDYLFARSCGGNRLTDDADGRDEFRPG